MCRKPSTPVQVISQVYGNEHSSGGGVDTHVVCGVVQELGSGVALNVMRVIVSPSELNVNPVFLCGGAVHHVPVGGGRLFISHKIIILLCQLMELTVLV